MFGEAVQRLVVQNGGVSGEQSCASALRPTMLAPRDGNQQSLRSTSHGAVSALRLLVAQGGLHQRTTRALPPRAKTRTGAPIVRNLW